VSATPEPAPFGLGVIPRLALPAGITVVAIGSRNGHIDQLAVGCGVLYVLAVVTVGICWSWTGSRFRPGSRTAVLWNAMAWANGAAGAAVAILGLWFVSRHTIVFSEGTPRVWPWMPLWLAIVGIGAVLIWTLLEIRRGQAAERTERSLLIVVVGSVAVFLAMSVLPGHVSSFQGFDDAQPMAGASLLDRGYFPWRDLLFIHGLFPDVLSGKLGMAVFGNTIWGVFAGQSVLLQPLCWVFLYLYAAWVSRGNPWFVAVVSVAIVSGFLPLLDTRFILVPLTLLLLGETLRRHRGIWCIGLVLVLFVQAIMVPETGFLAIPALACVFAADLVHRDHASGIWKAMRRTRWCVATGSVAVLVLGYLLASRDALSSFVDYYRVFGPGHNEAGAIPPGVDTGDYVLWAAGILVVLVTIWATANRVRRRGDWEPQDWVALAAAGFIAVFEEKALGRFDAPHIWQVFGVALPLILLWLWKTWRAGDAVIRSWPAVGRVSAPSVATAAAVSALVVCVVVFSDSFVSAAGRLESRHRMSAASYSNFPRVGYAAPDGVDTALLRDLDVALRTFAGDNAPVFDMTNSLGYVYYLLGRDPGTRFVHVSMAIPPFAQQLLIDELKRSRPPVVIFDSTRMGLANWDGISNEVRHYEVSRYILDGWVPVLRTHGNLLLLRRDLVRPGLPMPSLSEPPVTAGLWFSGAGCAWGASPNFLTSVPDGPSIPLPVRSLGTGMVVQVAGWAADRRTGRPAKTVVLVSGKKAVASLTPALQRPDVARVLGTASSASGFRFVGAFSGNEDISLYMLADDGKLHPLAGSRTYGVTSVEFPDGRILPTAQSPGGYVEEFKATNKTVGKIEIPSGLTLTDYHLATMSAEEPLGNSGVVITDDIAMASHGISAISLPRLEPTLAMRVGSCLQWHGYDASAPLYVVQDGGAPVTMVTLSGVRG
jgi:hypothetical protein